MSARSTIGPVRILPEELANKIAAGEVVERPASVVKELVENSLDAQATCITVRIVAAGRRSIEVVDNGHGMSEQDALLSIEHHSTSKIRKADDLDNIYTLGFRGEALGSIAAVSRFELVTRREKDVSATRLRVDGGILRDVTQIAAPVGTRVSANRLYFNTPVRAKFLRGITTELSHCIDVVQRHALASPGVGFQLFHNDKVLLDIPENASLRDRVALIWGLGFATELVEVEAEAGGFRFRGLIGSPGLTRSQRSHQFFFLNRRPIVNRSLQYGFEEGYRGLLTIGRLPVGILMIAVHPRYVDVNIHPTKREVRFRDDRAARDAIRDVVREALARFRQPAFVPSPRPVEVQELPVQTAVLEASPGAPVADSPAPAPFRAYREETVVPPVSARTVPPAPAPQDVARGTQTELPGTRGGAGALEELTPAAVYQPLAEVGDSPLQVFDTYLLVPEDDRLLIIDQHALHERLTFDRLCADLQDEDYASQQLAVPLLVDVPPSHTRLLESNLDVFRRMGIDIEPFGGNTFQVTGICHLYDEGKVPDAIYKVLDEAAQGELFDREEFLQGFLRLAVEACRSSVKAGDRLTPEERRGLLQGFRRLRPPYTCPHGRPIIVQITQVQMEKSFRRKQ